MSISQPSSSSSSTVISLEYKDYNSIINLIEDLKQYIEKNKSNSPQDSELIRLLDGFDTFKRVLKSKQKQQPIMIQHYNVDSSNNNSLIIDADAPAGNDSFSTTSSTTTSTSTSNALMVNDPSPPPTTSKQIDDTTPIALDRGVSAVSSTGTEIDEVQLDFLQEFAEDYDDISHGVKRKQVEEIECVICLSDVDVNDTHCVKKCSHTLCRPCIQTYCVGKIKEREFPIKCPYFGCQVDITVEDLDFLLDEDLITQFTEYSFERVIEVDSDQYSFCPTAGCGYIFFWEPGDSTDFLCPKCTKRYCFKCKTDYHVQSTCEQYQAWRKENGQADDLFDQFVTRQNFKKCPKCARFIEKTDGCEHIVCRCGVRFCYACGELFPCVCGKDVHVTPQQRQQALLMRQINQQQQQPPPQQPQQIVRNNVLKKVKKTADTQTTKRTTQKKKKNETEKKNTKNVNNGHLVQQQPQQQPQQHQVLQQPQVQAQLPFHIGNDLIRTGNHYPNNDNINLRNGIPFDAIYHFGEGTPTGVPVQQPFQQPQHQTITFQHPNSQTITLHQFNYPQQQQQQQPPPQPQAMTLQQFLNRNAVGGQANPFQIQQQQQQQQQPQQPRPQHVPQPSKYHVSNNNVIFFEDDEDDE